MAERKEVRLAGAGTHGMIQAGLILQEAAAIYDDLNAHHVQSYGPEARSNAAHEMLPFLPRLACNTASGLKRCGEL